MSNFIQFPARGEILGQLAALDYSGHWHNRFCEELATRLDSRVYDSAAFTFVLTEILYEHTEDEVEEGPEVVADVILALTHDRQLAIAALQTLDEIEALIAA
ncbi:MAG: hypothetical protein OES47_02490 [Acidobacteriota bacterium]|nr:hypothetical protein [Acidobacteriota bacterium]